MINDTANCYVSALKDLTHFIEEAQNRKLEKCQYFGMLDKASKDVQKGEFCGVPLIGRESIHRHFRRLHNQDAIDYNLYAKFIKCIHDGLKSRFEKYLTNPLLASYIGFLNWLESLHTPHFHTVEYDKQQLCDIMKTDSLTIDSVLLFKNVFTLTYML